MNVEVGDVLFAPNSGLYYLVDHEFDGLICLRYSAKSYSRYSRAAISKFFRLVTDLREIHKFKLDISGNFYGSW